MRQTCQQCGVPWEAKSPAARFCSPRCRKAHSRGTPPVSAFRSSAPVTGVTDESTVSRVRAELAAAGRLDTFRASAALALARRIDEATAVMGFAGLVKQLEATMDKVLEGVAVAADPVDELKARRDAIRAAS
jgi:hypothetical protein